MVTVFGVRFLKVSTSIEANASFTAPVTMNVAAYCLVLFFQEEEQKEPCVQQKVKNLLLLSTQSMVRLKPMISNISQYISFYIYKIII